MLSLLSDQNFWVVALGTMLLASAAGMVGSVGVLRGQSLIGDAVGHAALPGVVLAFMLFQSRNPLLLLLGAAGSGALAYFLIQAGAKDGKTKLDTLLAIVLSSFFGLGLVLKSYISGHPGYAKASQAGLSTYIFGQAAYLRKDDLLLLAVISLLALLFMLLFYKDIKLCTFDPGFAEAIGHKPKLIRGIVLLLNLLLIAAGLRVVGAILISGMLIAPSAAALQWSDRYGSVLGLAALFGAFSAWAGSLLSSAGRGLSTGPSIILFMSAIALLSLLFGHKGPLARRRRKKTDGSEAEGSQKEVKSDV